MRQTNWFDRQFPPISDNGLLPPIIERLEGTPQRIKNKVAGLDSALLTRKNGDKWSIQEEVGHLGDVESLWIGRVDDLIHGVPELRVADLTNRTTHEAQHNSAELKNLLEEFQKQRQQLVARLRQASEEQLNNSALHPRLKIPMRMVDLAYFVAEHDDHHLAKITEMINTANSI